MLKVSDIRNAYQNLWNQFDTAVSNSGLVAKSYFPNGINVTKQGHEITAHAFIYLPNWPYKAVTDRKKIHILLQSSEVYDENTSKIIRSTVQIGYFDIGDNEATSLLQIHYDFELPVAEAHPIFHAQLGETNWPVEKCKEVRFPMTQTLTAPPQYSNARIPTPHVGFGAALLALAADHLKRQCYASFISSMRTNESVKWQASCDTWLNSCGKHGWHPHSLHWY